MRKAIFYVLLGALLSGGISFAITEQNPFQEPPTVTHAVFNPENVIPRTRRVYIREYSNWTPPNGAPIFYAPFPRTLCMLGEGPGKEVRIIYEGKLGACEELIQVSDGHLVRPIKHRQGGDHLKVAGPGAG